MQAKDSVTIAYSAEPQVLTVSVLKNGAMSVLQALADLGIISIRKELSIMKIFDIKSVKAIKKKDFLWKMPKKTEINAKKIDALVNSSKYLLLMIEENFKDFNDVMIPGLTFSENKRTAIWIAVIELETKKVLNWNFDEEWSCHIKVSDRGTYYLLDENMNVLTGSQNYVPDLTPEDHYGDYIILNIAPDGTIMNWDRDVKSSEHYYSFYEDYS